MYFWPERKKLRFSNYDYSRNWFYFITICTKNRENYFGEIIDEKMILNEYGKIVENEILKTEELRKEIKIDIFVIMPNHIHLIIIIENNLKNEITHTDIVRNTGPCSLQTWNYHKNKLSNSIQRMKSSVTLNIRNQYNDFQFFWQKSFYDVVIKNDEQLEKTRQYILDNPSKWEDDINNKSK